MPYIINKIHRNFNLSNVHSTTLASDPLDNKVYQSSKCRFHKTALQVCGDNTFDAAQRSAVPRERDEIIRVLRRWGGHIRSREVTYLPLSDDCLRGLISSTAARCEPLASLER